MSAGAPVKFVNLTAIVDAGHLSILQTLARIFIMLTPAFHTGWVYGLREH